MTAFAGIAAAQAQDRKSPKAELFDALAPPTTFANERQMMRKLPALAKKYPRDPRLQCMHAIILSEAKDPAGAEKAARRGLAEEALWSTIFGEDAASLSDGCRYVLGHALQDQGKNDEAKPYFDEMGRSRQQKKSP